MSAGAPAAWTRLPRARAAWARGDARGALAVVERALAAAPGDAELLALSAELKRHPLVARWSEAVEDAARSLAAAPRAPWAAAVRARALAAAGRAQDALGALPARGPGWVEAERALLLLAAGRGPQALRAARRAETLDPRGLEAALAAACALARAGDLPAAAARARRAASAAAAPPFRRPGAPAPEPWSLLADLEAALGRAAPAAAARRRAAAAGASPAWPLPADADGRARTLAALEALTASRPRDAWAWAWLGQAAREAGDGTKARAALDRALRLDPAHSAARAWRAGLREASGDLAGAAADLAAARARAGAHGLAAGALERERGRVLLAAGRPGAAAALARAAALGPDRARARLLLALARRAEGRTDLAREALDLCLEEAPDLREAYAERASLRAKSDRAGRALDLARAAGAAVPAEPARDPRDGGGPGEGPATRGRGRAFVDGRLELVGVLQAALQPAAIPAGARRRLPELAAYADEVRGRFAPRVDAALKDAFARTAAARGNKDFPWFGVSQMLMQASPLPELATSSPAWRAPEDAALLVALRRFAERSELAAFLEASRPRFRAWTRGLDRVLGAEDYARSVSEYAGRRVSAYYEVALSPSLTGVSLRAILRETDGTRGSRTTLCPLGGEEEQLRAYLGEDRAWPLWTGWHETLHLLLDPWCGLHEPEARRYERLYASYPPRARRKNWMDCFSEQFVRAATQRMIRARLGTKAQAALAEADRREGYRAQDALAEALAEYEQDRCAYPSLLAFMPRWIEAWERVR